MLIKTSKPAKKPILHYTPAQEAHIERKMEEKFRSQRELKNGRNFLWNSFRFKDETDMAKFRKNFDSVFPNAPGSGL